MIDYKRYDTDPLGLTFVGLAAELMGRIQGEVKADSLEEISQLGAMARTGHRRQLAVIHDDEAGGGTVTIEFGMRSDMNEVTVIRQLVLRGGAGSFERRKPGDPE